MTSQIEIKKATLMQRVCYIFLLAVIALIFIPTGVMKFMDNEQIITNFSKWDLLSWKEIIGSAELIGTLLLLIPRTNLLGVLLLTGIMGGAFYTHITHAEPYFFNLAIVLVIWINYLFVKQKKTTHNIN